MAGTGLKRREEVRREDTWAIEDLYESDEAWEGDYKRLETKILELAAYEGHLGDGPEALLGMQRTWDELHMLAEKVYVYAGQRLHEDTDNGHYQNLAARAQGLLIKLSEAGAYIEPEILALPEGTVEKFLTENEALQVYRQYFENMIRRRQHVLDKEREELLAAIGELAEGPKDIFTMFNNADLRFPVIQGEDGEPVEVTHGRYMTLLQSSERSVRQAAFEALYKTYGQYRNTLAAAYRANVKQEIFYAKARNYQSDLEAALNKSHIPVSVYDNLIQAVHEHLPQMYRYLKLRRRFLHVEELHMYDLYTPMEIGRAHV